MAKKRAKQQRFKDPALPAEIENIEEQVDAYLKAKSAQTREKRKADAAYDSLKSLMTDHELQVYDCHQRKYRVELKHRDDEIKVKERKTDD